MNNFELGLLILFLLCWIIQMAYLFLFLLLDRGKPKADLVATEGVSVVICAKNEAHNLKRHLPFLLDQKYPMFEVIVVNDGSTDNTQSVLEEMAEKHSHLRILTTPDVSAKGKKKALAHAFEHAQYDRFLLTDADCKPLSSQWIQKMTQNFNDKTQLVLGYGGYERRPGLLNLLIRFETIHNAMLFFSFANLGMPYMGVGRNLAYTRGAFESSGGFAQHEAVFFGDDDLFVQHAATSENVAVELQREAHTSSIAKKKWSNWVRQKKRHLQASSHYKTKFKVLLSAYPTSSFLLLILFFLLLVSTNQSLVLFLLYFLKVSAQIVIFRRSLRLLLEDIPILFVPLFELFFLILNPVVYFTNWIEKPNQWN